MLYAGIVAIFDDAHDLDVQFAASARESDAQRIASREKILDELLIDNRDLRTAEIVALRKFTARDERDAHLSEKARADFVEHRMAVAILFRGCAFDRDVIPPIASTNQRHHGGGHALHARNRG